MDDRCYVSRTHAWGLTQTQLHTHLHTRHKHAHIYAAHTRAYKMSQQCELYCRTDCLSASPLPSPQFCPHCLSADMRRHSLTRRHGRGARLDSCCLMSHGQVGWLGAGRQRAHYHTQLTSSPLLNCLAGQSAGQAAPLLSAAASLPASAAVVVVVTDVARVVVHLQ